MEQRSHPTRQVVRSRVSRWVMAAIGVLCVVVGAVGVVVPGLPTTVFLLAASWLFTRSCPWLEDRLLRGPVFAPFRRYLQPGAAMPVRAVVVSLLTMWSAIALSAILLLSGEVTRSTPAVAAVVAGLVGSAAIIAVYRRRRVVSLVQVPLPDPVTTGSVGSVQLCRKQR